MKKGLILTISIIGIIIVGFIIFTWFNNNQNTTNDNGGQYEATRILAENQNQTSTKETEIELYSFSTPIKTDDENRLTNIRITCSRINRTIIESGKEFSFCDIVGKPTAEDGYKPADAFGEDNKIIKSIGGGNCQVSTTVYNAALGVDGLKITERHEHDRAVSYIEDGKDATIAYDYLDLKFKNTNDFDIKLYSFVSDNKVIVKIFKIT